MTDREAIGIIDRMIMKSAERDGNPDVRDALETAIYALQEREKRSKEGKSLREKIERYKIESGFASATPEERAMLAESLIDTLKSLDINPEVLLRAYYDMKWGRIDRD